MARMSVEERRGALIASAIEVMKRKGVANTSTRDIVSEAGMQIGVFHYCFQSKEQLIRAVMRTINERSYSAVGDALGEVEEGRTPIHTGVMAYWHHIQSDPNEHLLTYELTTHALRNLRAQAHDEATAEQLSVVSLARAAEEARVGGEVEPDAAKVQYENYLTGMSALLAMLEQLLDTSFRTDSASLSRLVLAAIEGITLQWLVDTDDESARSSLHLLADVLAADAGLT